MEGKRRNIVLWGLMALGIAMIVIGLSGRLLPPILTGIGFLLLAWGFWGKATL